nr:hypothetical protein KPHV_20140 [Kitasatospora purpeofusca]
MRRGPWAPRDYGSFPDLTGAARAPAVACFEDAYGFRRSVRSFLRGSGRAVPAGADSRAAGAVSRGTEVRAGGERAGRGAGKAWGRRGGDRRAERRSERRGSARRTVAPDSEAGHPWGGRLRCRARAVLRAHPDRGEPFRHLPRGRVVRG